MADWIFFDCFNTLLDEQDGLTDESGMAPVAHVPVAAGYFASAHAFKAAYLSWRRLAWPDPDKSPEIPLATRLEVVLSRQAADRSVRPRATVAETVDRMVTVFHERYPATITPTAGVEAMLKAWCATHRLAVVSNFFVAGMPERLLARFGLQGYFEFIVDSAALGWKKPDARIYRSALQLARCPERRALYVGDNLRNDVLAPRALGIDALYLNRRATPVPNDVKAIASWDEFRPEEEVGGEA